MNARWLLGPLMVGALVGCRREDAPPAPTHGALLPLGAEVRGEDLGRYTITSTGGIAVEADASAPGLMLIAWNAAHTSSVVVDRSHWSRGNERIAEDGPISELEVRARGPFTVRVTHASKARVELDRLLRKGDRDWQRGAFGPASAAYQGAAVERAPVARTWALLGMARAATKAGDAAGATAALERALRDPPSDRRLVVEIHLARAELGSDLAAAEKAREAAATLDDPLLVARAELVSARVLLATGGDAATAVERIQRARGVAREAQDTVVIAEAEEALAKAPR